MDPSARTRHFRDWQLPEELGAEIGRGKYGRVLLCGDEAVVKVLNAENGKRAAWRRVKQSYREHVLGIIQSLMVTRSMTPHLVMHFGASVVPSPGRCSISLYMERFEGSLEAAGEALLRSAQDWRGLLFQVTSAMATLAVLLQVVQNDLYPRNILFKRLPAECHAVYDIFGKGYSLATSTLFAITDFGICGSPLLDSRLACSPEVHVPPQARPKDFGLWHAPHHVLSYPDLPPYSRDAYLAFKWPVYRSRHLPPAPEDVKAWATDALTFLDLHAEAFNKPEGLLRLLHHAFVPERRLAREATPAQALVFRVGSEDQDSLLQDGLKLLQAMPFNVS